MLERRYLKNLDFNLILLVLAIMGIGLMAIGSATNGLIPDDPFSYVKKQALWIVLGAVAAFIVLTIDYTDFMRFSNILYGLNLALLALVVVAGNSSKGSQRWIGVGPLEIQPSEIAKIVVILTLASYLASREGRIRSWFDLIPALLHMGVPAALVLLQPDLGTSLVFVAILFGMIFMAGVSWTYLVVLGGAGLGAVVSVILLQLNGVITVLKDYQLNRLIVFLNPEYDRWGAGWHIFQSKIALGSGGVLGKGLFAGTQNQRHFLPEQHTDFIFSVIGEEAGLVGTILVLLLFFMLLWRGMQIANSAKDVYGTLVVTGIVSMWLFQLFINIGMTMGTMPITGLPLPFVSYGGSSLLTNAVGVGLILNVYMRRQKILF